MEDGSEEETSVVVGGVERGMVSVCIGLQGGVKGRGGSAFLLFQRFHLGDQPFLLLLLLLLLLLHRGEGGRGRGLRALVARCTSPSSRHRRRRLVVVVDGKKRQQLCALGTQGALDALLFLQSLPQSSPRLLHLSTPRHTPQGGRKIPP
jgi:hypothetical protein